MIVKHVGTSDVDYVIVPELDETITVRRDYQPWFLGFSKWSVVRQTHRGNGVFSERLAQGRWRWRGLRARYTETPV